MRIWTLTASAVFAASVGCGGNGDSGLSDTIAAGGNGGQAGIDGSSGTGGDLTADGAPGDTSSDVPAVDTPSAIICGTMTCPLSANRVCCIDHLSTAPYQCSDRGLCPAAMQTPVELGCANDANCGAGAVCCLSHSGGVNAVARCQTACYPADAHLCDRTAAKTGCEAFQTCSSTGIEGWGLPAASYAMCN